MRNVHNIIQHELIGVSCEVVDAQNKAQVGLKGKIVDETMKTLLIDAHGYKRVPKKGTELRVHLDKTARIQGDDLIARPEDRIKKKQGRW